MNDDGLISMKSAHSVRETIDRLARIVTSKGMTVFARVDHAANATSVGMTLRPTELLVFGSPRGGTPLMEDRQTIGVDLPLRALAWQDADGVVWLTFEDARWLATRHGLAAASGAAVEAIRSGLAASCAAATSTGA